MTFDKNKYEIKKNVASDQNQTKSSKEEKMPNSIDQKLESIIQRTKKNTDGADKLVQKFMDVEKKEIKE